MFHVGYRGVEPDVTVVGNCVRRLGPCSASVGGTVPRLSATAVIRSMVGAVVSWSGLGFLLAVDEALESVPEVAGESDYAVDDPVDGSVDGFGEGV